MSATAHQAAIDAPKPAVMKLPEHFRYLGPSYWNNRVDHTRGMAREKAEFERWILPRGRKAAS